MAALITRTVAGFSGPLPSQVNPVDFDVRAEARVQEMGQFSDDLNAWGTQANGLSASVTDLSAMTAADSAAAQAAAVTAAAQGNSAALWAGAAAVPGDMVVGSDGAAYRCQVANTGVDPVGDTTGTWSPPLTLDPDLITAALMGGGIYPGWDMRREGPLGTYPPAEAAKPAATIWWRGDRRLRAVYTWGSGDTAYRIASIRLEWSLDGGSSWLPAGSPNTLTYTYSAAGTVDDAQWSTT